MEKRNLISPFQHGFRKKHECLQQISSLLNITHSRKLARNFGKKLQTWIAFIDFEKAYDSVWHDGLFFAMAKFGIGGAALRFIRALYSVQSARVATDVGLTDHFSIRKGVRQGCVLSPFLFNIYINSLLENPSWNPVKIFGSKIKFHGLLYADDVAILAPSKIQLTRALDHISRWCDFWKMKINASKCGIMHIGHRFPSRTEQKFLPIGEHMIPCVNKYKYLGYTITYNLQHTQHIHKLKKDMNKELNRLSYFLQKPNIPITTKILVIKQQIQSIPC